MAASPPQLYHAAVPAIGFTPTSEQLEAIRLADRSVLVSAAAGSGKTAVLAERCAYLVCDDPDCERCGVDELLVLTFTEAAAAEMRSRIMDSIRARAAAKPHESRLRDQLALADTAQISTIHAFCLWLIRRWFSDIGIDPTAEVMDAEESALLKRQVLEELFAAHYEMVRDHDDPLGTKELGATTDGGAVGQPATSPPALSAEQLKAGEFCRLVDDYGLGEDRDIAAVVLRIYEFTTSLPDWEGWLCAAVEQLEGNGAVLARTMDAMLAELKLQAEHCRAVAESMAANGPQVQHYAEQIEAYAKRVEQWHGVLAASLDLGAYERVCQEVAAFSFDAKRAPRLEKDTDEQIKAMRDAAGECLSLVKKKLFDQRLKNRFTLFSLDTLVADMRRTAPYAATLAGLVRDFAAAYATRKRRHNLLDFADLERFAHELLSGNRESERNAGPAASLRRRFAHILIDESQDINPLQESIVRLASREPDPQRRDNLFSVGDVKQSIYRFRLAEPGLFTARLLAFHGEGGDGSGAAANHALDSVSRRNLPGRALFLQKNFRSRPEILEAVNTVFRPLMSRDFGGVPYDAHAELRPGRVMHDPPQPIELHLLERKWEGAADSADGEEAEANETSAAKSEAAIQFADPTDPAQWTAIEREACLIGQKIREWMDEGSKDPARPRRLRDVAVLLRATRVNAERTAAVLNAMGIPAFAQVGGSLFGAREVRDVIAALQVLDNPRQDIPLVGVLRSGILGLRLSIDELAEIRLVDRAAPYHLLVKEYATRGPDGDLRQRLALWLGDVERLRDRARRRPLSETLWLTYADCGYLAYAAGLPNGAQRRANLLKLHDLARKFGSFRRQGLHRFLQFLAALQAEDSELDVAPVIGESEDVVRIISIHQSKGLEFPLVFVAGLGSQFNLGDRNGRIIFERKSKIGMRVVDPARMIEYPSAAHSLVADEIERTSREEELRILYVAMTRARDKLVLIGSSREVARWGHGADVNVIRPPLTPLTIAGANTPLDWLLPVVTADERTISIATAGAESRGVNAPLFTLHLHSAEVMAGWTIAASEDGGAEIRRAVAALEPLPAGEPLPADDAAVQQIVDRIGLIYPHLPATAMPAAVGVSAVAAEAARDAMEEAEFPFEARVPGPVRRRFEVPPSKYVHGPRTDAAWRGIVTHQVLQHLDFGALASRDSAGRLGAITAEIERMAAAGIVTKADADLVDRSALDWFLSTSLAWRIQTNVSGYHREIRFLSTESIDRIDSSQPPGADRVLIRGMIDAVLVTPSGLELIDFKTDAVSAHEVAARARDYEPQLRLYAAAAEKLWRRPVVETRLVFLTPREIVSVARVEGVTDGTSGVE